ncbi:aspartyl-tRNA(Asn)/glutamyl-tRNA(Gln) amidotransferase subunit A [Amorphus suaedae]
MSVVGWPEQESARSRLEKARSRISDPNGEGPRACLTVYDAEAAADVADLRRSQDLCAGPLDGAIVTIKDLFGVAGEPTRAGSKALAQRSEPERRDCTVVQRLRAGGAAILAKTNMSEFAFSGVGLNPHFDTPGNPVDPTRIPGGSSSGAAVSVAAGYCDVAIGTDTGGSARIPAALCGLVGFKPTQRHIPRDGVVPLSRSLDCVGPLARTVDACARAFAVLADRPLGETAFPSLRGVRLGAVTGMPLDGVDGEVGPAYEAALSMLSAAGAVIEDIHLPQLEAMAALNAAAGLVPVEAYAAHRAIVDGGDPIDPLIRRRLERGRTISASDYLNTIDRRQDLIASLGRLMLPLDGLVMPTVPIIAPTFEDVAAPEDFDRLNALLLRNTTIANFFGLPSISLPVPARGMPVGIMLTMGHDEDERLLALARTVERILTDRDTGSNVEQT